MGPTQRVSEVLAAASSRLRPPRGHKEIDRKSFDKLVWPDYQVELPSGAGWATCRVGSSHFCTWFDAPKDGAAS